MVFAAASASFASSANRRCHRIVDSPPRVLFALAWYRGPTHLPAVSELVART
jgi:hypothetical protein